MSEDKGFLQRWAQRKSAARSAPAPADLNALPIETAEDVAFDVTTLPDIESLTATSDITGFLQKGVPMLLRNAALQRIWATDPAIRDFVGPSEMNWDFNSAEVFHGYGALAPGTDVAGMVREIAGDRIEQVMEAVASDAEQTAALPSAEPSDVAEVAELTDESTAEQTTAELQLLASEDVPEPDRPIGRRHGGAAPKIAG